MSKRMYHPCHKLSVPSAKLYWCRHCMQMFEDAISRWKHSRICHASPGYRQVNKDSKVIQMYVKPDTVSYTSNVIPGEGVYHKPHHKKTSAELKCMICATKFASLYDMREHVKYPCQRSNIVVAPQLVNFDPIDEAQQPDGHIKIRRIEAEDDILGSNTALSVLAEASKHVESLASVYPIEQQVIEEIPQVDEQITETTSDSFTVKSESGSSQDLSQTDNIFVAYPRLDLARPELGKVCLVLQGDNGVDLPDTFLTTDIIQECLKETAKKLPKGQIIEVQLSNSDKSKVLHFVVSSQGTALPYYSACTPGYSNQSHQSSQRSSHQHTSLLESDTSQTVNRDNLPAEFVTDNQATVSQISADIKPSPSTLEQILTGNLDVHVLQGGVIEVIKQQSLANKPVVTQQQQVPLPTAVIVESGRSLISVIDKNRVVPVPVVQSEIGTDTGNEQELFHSDTAAAAHIISHNTPVPVSLEEAIEQSGESFSGGQTLSYEIIGNTNHQVIHSVNGQRLTSSGIVGEDSVHPFVDLKPVQCDLTPESFVTGSHLVNNLESSSSQSIESVDIATTCVLQQQNQGGQVIPYFSVVNSGAKSLLSTNFNNVCSATTSVVVLGSDQSGSVQQSPANPADKSGNRSNKSTGQGSVITVEPSPRETVAGRPCFVVAGSSVDCQIVSPALQGQGSSTSAQQPISQVLSNQDTVKGWPKEVIIQESNPASQDLVQKLFTVVQPTVSFIFRVISYSVEGIHP